MSETIQFPRNGLADAAGAIGREIDTATPVVDTPLVERQLPLCIDCQYCIITRYSHECGAPQNMRGVFDLVTGEHKLVPHFKSCSTHRLNDAGVADGTSCGKSGRWFTDKGSARGES
jgi:hypothetical protein